MSEKSIHFSYHTPEIGLIVVNRPKVKNALNLAMMEKFSHIVNNISLDNALRVILITGSDDSFISGADINQWINYPDREGGRKLATVMGDALQKLSALPTINIALINGSARGGGAEIAIMCDMRIMGEHASIAFVHATLGLIPGWGGGERLFHTLGYSKSIELLSTAKVLNAEQALNIGLVNQVVESSNLFEVGLEMANNICNNAPQATFAIKNYLHDLSFQSSIKIQKRERQLFIDLWETNERKALFSNALKKSK